MRAQMNLSAFEARREPVLDGIFDDRLQQHAGNESFERLLVDFLEDLQLVAAEANHFDVEIVVDELELLAQRHERFVLAQQPPQNIRKLQHHAAGHVRIEADQRRDGIERIEQKMRIDLAGQARPCAP